MQRLYNFWLIWSKANNLSVMMMMSRSMLFSKLHVVTWWPVKWCVVIEMRSLVIVIKGIVILLVRVVLHINPIFVYIIMHIYVSKSEFELVIIMVRNRSKWIAKIGINWKRFDTSFSSFGFGQFCFLFRVWSVHKFVESKYTRQE